LKIISSGLILFHLGTAVGIFATITWSAILIALILFLSMGTNWALDIADILRTTIFSIFKIIYATSKNKAVSGTYSAMYVLENSQLQGCIKSCGLSDVSRREKLHILRLVVDNRNNRDKTPTAKDSQRYVKADCIFNCSMRFMVSMIAELFGALNACIKNTSSVQFRVKGDAVQEIMTLKLDPGCEPIRDELYSISNDFNEFLKLAFKGDHNAMNQWRNALNNQIRNVLNGQHSRPISVKYDTSTTITPVVFEF